MRFEKYEIQLKFFTTHPRDASGLRFFLRPLLTGAHILVYRKSISSEIIIVCRSSHQKFDSITRFSIGIRSGFSNEFRRTKFKSHASSSQILNQTQLQPLLANRQTKILLGTKPGLTRFKWDQASTVQETNSRWEMNKVQLLLQLHLQILQTSNHLLSHF
ncbi:unnamed protein product [Caenorhabditis brenneri]